MNIAFILTMPGRNSWNGKWSGDEKVWAETRSVRTPKHNIVPERFSYDFGDGWRAAIDTRVVTAAERRKLLKRSAGFCGYQWMIESIISDGAIYGPTQPKPEAQVPA